MSAIDWDKLYRATNQDNKPTPGYLFNEIVQEVSNANPKEIPAVAEYLADCVDGDHAHVKLKALFVIKTLAFRIPPFCRCAQERIASVQEAAVFTGPPSALFGDEPYRLVREAAEGALEALTGGEFYHEQYRQMSQRIVGFGNYQPAADTVLPDGSVNVARDVTLGDVALSTVGFLQSRAGALLGGVKDILTSPFRHSSGIDGLGEMDDAEDPDYADEGELQDDRPDVGEDGYYPDAAGTYVPPYFPPALPMPSSATEQPDLMSQDELAPEGCSHQEACFAAAVSLLDSEDGDFAAAPSLQEDDLSEDAILDILGLGGGTGPPQTSQ
ncbi:unnamed protein product, partial [Polarella glacialis]